MSVSMYDGFNVVFFFHVHIGTTTFAAASSATTTTDNFIVFITFLMSNIDGSIQKKNNEKKRMKIQLNLSGILIGKKKQKLNFGCGWTIKFCFVSV